ncbi:hypothetical protein R1flu_019133 [Riccia fluitans]|uniref:Uncharacterized protein n=1 Tax=Riccia fluitans TaxID=41844 RepID=A0ABD1ZJA6_9MARC
MSSNLFWDPIHVNQKQLASLLIRRLTPHIVHWSVEDLPGGRFASHLASGILSGSTLPQSIRTSFKRSAVSDDFTVSSKPLRGRPVLHNNAVRRKLLFD